MAHIIFDTFGPGFFAQNLVVVYLFLAFFAAVGDSASIEGDSEQQVPWQPNPSRRGALAILQSCIFTIVACTWSIQHLNVPSPVDRPSDQIWRKIRAAVLTVLLPESVLAQAIVERSAAIKSLHVLKNDPERKIDDLEVSQLWSLWNRLRDLMCCYSVQAPGSPEAGVEMGEPRTKWTLTHSYYANMGGLRLGTSTGESICTYYQTIALTTRQFGFLRKTDVIKESPRLSEKETKDKGKTELFTKGIAVLQMSELILSLITRAARNRAISQLEIITVAFAACAMVTYCFSWNKPQDGQTSTTILIPRRLSHEEERDVMELQPEELLVLLAGTVTEIKGARFDRIHNGSIELSESLVQPVSVWLTFAVMIFGAIHLAAWNFAFPSQSERTMWRISSTAITVLPLSSLLNSFMSSKFYAAKKEVQDFQISLISLWDDYFDSFCTSQGVSLPDLFHPLGSVYFDKFVHTMAAWGEEQIAALRAFVSTLPPTPSNQVKRENFEWFMSNIKEGKLEVWRQSATRVLQQGEILRSLRERAGRQVSTLDRAASFIGENAGAYILLITAFIYAIFRICIIVLALISLRSMPDSVYDTPWAKNIPSVQ